MSDMDALRGRILEIDDEILGLIAERTETARRIGELKAARGEPLQNFAVEKNVLLHAQETMRTRALDIDSRTIQDLVRLLIQAALKVQERERVRSDEGAGRHALVVGGHGLMGGWFARFLAEQGYTVHVDDPNDGPRPSADYDGTRYDVAVLAVPPSQLEAVLDDVVRRLPNETLVFDIASVKGEAAGRIRSLARNGHRVASLHPMFGPAAELLMGHHVLVLDSGADEAASAAARLFANTTASAAFIPLEEHDALVAEVLGLAHAVSIVFNRALATGPYAYEDLRRRSSTTFQKQTAVSSEVARENPRLYYEIQTLNPHTRMVLGRLKDALDAFVEAVETEDFDSFQDLMRSGRAYYEGGTSARK